MSSVSTTIMIILAVLQESGENKQELPLKLGGFREWIASEDREVIEVSRSIDSNKKTVDIKLPKLQCGVRYKIDASFANPLLSPLKVSELKADCGCLRCFVAKDSAPPDRNFN